jgi:predicted  nucleic acid-binding Zn-ribbon protein
VLRHPVTFGALKLHSSFRVKRYVHDVVQRLMELTSLEERLATCSRHREERTNIEALIESLRAGMPVGVLIAHDRMQARGRQSVAEVRKGVCSGCHLGLGFGNVNRLKAGLLHRCGNCGRFLYLAEEEEEDSEPPAPTTPSKARRKPSEKSTATP